MKLQRGDIVVVDFPQQTGQPAKRRPVVVVQCDPNNRRLSNSVFAMVTSNLKLAATESTQFVIDISTPDGKQSGLLRTSAIKCENLYTLPQAVVRQKIGRLSVAHQSQLNSALKASLGIP
jgi:mRNA interferase MazF